VSVTRRRTKDSRFVPLDREANARFHHARASVADAIGWRQIVRRYFTRPSVDATNPPWFDARGVAVGLAVGFGLPIGTQMLCLGLLRILFRFNFLIAFTFTWVNNPLTLLPMYYGYYCLGSLILGKTVVMSAEAFRELMLPVMHADHFWASLKAFADLSVDVVARWAASALVVGITSGILGYAVGFYVQRRRCFRRARQLGTSYERLVKELEEGILQRRKDEPS
jgi:uncharacterized protein